MVDIGKAGQEQQHIKGDAHPAVHDHHRRHGPGGAGEPFRPGDADAGKQVVDEACVHKDVLAQKTGDGHGHHVGNQDHPADGAGQLKILLKEQGEQEADGKLENQAENGKFKGIAQYLAEGFVFEQVNIILQPNKNRRAAFQIFNVHVLKTQYPIIQQGIAHDKQNIENGRQNEHIGFQLFCLGSFQFVYFQ